MTKNFGATTFASLLDPFKGLLITRWAMALFAAWILADVGTVSAQEVLTFDTSSATSTEDRLMTIDQLGGATVTLVNSSSFTSTPGKMAVDRATRRIYFCDQFTGSGGVFRVNADGTSKTTIFSNSTSGSQVLGVAVDSTHGVLYIVTSNATASEDKLISCGLDGSSPTVLVSGASFTAFPGAIAVDEVNRKIYACDILAGGGGVFRFDSDGSNKTTIYANSASGSQTFGVAVDSSRGNVYIITSNASSSEDKLIKCGLSGSSPTVLVSGASLTTFPNQVAVDMEANRLYVTDSQTAGGGVFRFDSAGGSKTQVFTNSTSGRTMISVALNSASSTTISSLNRVDATPSSASTVNWTATFASAVFNVAAANFSLTGTAASGATVGTPTTSDAGFNWNIPVTVTSSGTLQLNLANSTTMSAAISTSLPFSGQSYTMSLDSTGPTVTIGSPSVSATAGGPVSYTITYADPAFSASTLTAGDITVNSTGSASASSVSVTGSGTTRTVTLSSLTGNGTLGISIAAGTASDTFGNLALVAGPSTTFTVDNTAPSVSIGSPSVSATKAGPVSFTVTYTDAHFSSATLSAGDITVNSTGSADVSSVSVTGSGTTRTVTLSGISGNGTLGISLSSDTAVDTAGNLAGSAGPSTTFSVDNAGPVVTIGAPSVTITRNGPVVFTVGFSDPHFSSSSLIANFGLLNTTGTASLGSLSVSGTAANRTVTLSSLTGDGTIAITIPANAATDTLGNKSVATGPSAFVIVDHTAPSVSISAPSQSVTTGGPVSYTVTFADANFDSAALLANQVTVNSTGTATAGSVDVTGSGTTWTVTLGSLSGDGTLGISLPAGLATDGAGNTSGAASPSTTFAVDNTAPTVAIGSPSVSATRSGPVTYTVTYSDANFSTATLTATSVRLS